MLYWKAEINALSIFYSKLNCIFYTKHTHETNTWAHDDEVWTIQQIFQIAAERKQPWQHWQHLRVILTRFI